MKNLNQKEYSQELKIFLEENKYNEEIYFNISVYTLMSERLLNSNQFSSFQVINSSLI